MEASKRQTMLMYKKKKARQRFDKKTEKNRDMMRVTELRQLVGVVEERVTEQCQLAAVAVAEQFNPNGRSVREYLGFHGLSYLNKVNMTMEQAIDAVRDDQIAVNSSVRVFLDHVNLFPLYVKGMTMEEAKKEAKKELRLDVYYRFFALRRALLRWQSSRSAR